MSAADCLVFDIETVPDAELGRRLGFAGDDLAVAGQMLARREEETGSSFLPLEQHRVVAISTLLRSGDQLQVWSLGSVDSPEDDLVRRFFGGIDKLVPTLVSWNGSGFDLPVLHYRMLRHGIASPAYWDAGERGIALLQEPALGRQRQGELAGIAGGSRHRGASCRAASSLSVWMEAPTAGTLRGAPTSASRLS